METKGSLLYGKNGQKGLLALGVKDLWISFEPLDTFSWDFVGGDAIQGDLVVIFNPIASVILKWLGFKVVR
jgi:hypothetical protein